MKWYQNPEKKKNNTKANGNAKANLTYAEATNDKSLFNFFCNEVLRFWKKAAKIVKTTQFINLFRYNLLIELSGYLYLKNQIFSISQRASSPKK